MIDHHPPPFPNDGYNRRLHNGEDKRGCPLFPDTCIIRKIFVKLSSMYREAPTESKFQLRKERNMMSRKALPDRKRKGKTFLFQIPLEKGELTFP